MRSRLFIGSLADDATEQELRDLFAQVGEVVEASIISDWGTGRSRGFGFVQMATEEQALEAIEKLHGAELHGRGIRVTIAEPKGGGARPGEKRPIVERKPATSNAAVAAGDPGVIPAPSDLPRQDVDPAERGGATGSDASSTVPDGDSPAVEVVAGAATADTSPIEDHVVDAPGEHDPTSGSPAVADPSVDASIGDRPAEIVPSADHAIPPASGQADGRRGGGVPVLLVAAVAASLVIAALVFFMVPRSAPVPVDDGTLLIVPLEVYGQSDGADYLGYAFAQAVAVNLAPVGGLRVLPVPQATELKGSTAQAHAQTAATLGAGRLLLGSLTRKADRVHANITVVDSVENRILWGTQKEGRDSEILGLAAEFAREVADQLGVAFPALHVYVTDLAGDAEMAAAPEVAGALGALRRGEVEQALTATAALVERLPEHPSALALRSHALVLQWDAEPSAANLKQLTAAVRRLDQTGRGYPYTDFYRAYIALREGRPKEAIQGLGGVLERGELAPAARAWMLRYRAVAQQQLGQLPSALEDLTESLRLDPTNAWTLTILSGALVDIGKLEQGLARARQGLALVPSYWRNHQALAYALSALGRHQEASAAYGKACELGRAQLPCSLFALELRKAGLDEEAGAAAESAAKLFETAWGTYNLACHWSLAGDREQALAFLKRAVELGLADRTIVKDPDLQLLYEDPTYQALKDKVLDRLTELE